LGVHVVCADPTLSLHVGEERYQGGLDNRANRGSRMDCYVPGQAGARHDHRVLRVPRDRLELLAARLVDQRGDFDRASGVIR
jgi:hypothetical protein